MTIARRLGALLAVPLVVLLGLAGLLFSELTLIESRTQFVSQVEIPALAMVGNVSRAFEQLRVQLRTHLLARTPAERARAVASFEAAGAAITRLLNDYLDDPSADDRGPLWRILTSNTRLTLGGGEPERMAPHRITNVFDPIWLGGGHSRAAFVLDCVGAPRGVKTGPDAAARSAARLLIER